MQQAHYQEVQMQSEYEMDHTYSSQGTPSHKTFEHEAQGASQKFLWSLYYILAYSNTILSLLVHKMNECVILKTIL